MRFASRVRNNNELFPKKKKMAGTSSWTSQGSGCREKGDYDLILLLYS